METTINYIIIVNFVFLLSTLHSKDASVYFMASLREADGKIAAALINTLSIEQQGGAIARYEKKFGKYQPPAPVGAVKDSPEYKQLQSTIQADGQLVKDLATASEVQKIKKFGELLTNPQYSGGKIAETLQQKKKNGSQEEVAAIKETAQQVVNAYSPLTK